VIHMERFTRSPKRDLLLASLVLMPAILLAQTNTSASATSDQSPSRWDIFLGYSYLAPHGTVTTTTPSTTTITEPDFLALTGTAATTDPPGTPIVGTYHAVNEGAIFSGAYYFNRYVGVQAELGEHKGGNNDGFLTVGGGLILRYPMDQITVFAHGLVDAAQVNGPVGEPNQWGPGLTAGGGMDYETPWLNHRLAIRLFQADYEYMHADWGQGAFGGRANINAARLSAGLVIHVGSLAPPPPVTLACPATPTSVYAGDPVTLTATAGGLNPKDHVVYGWSGQGVAGNDTTAKLDTSALAPGNYTVNCSVKEGKPGKEGLKPWETATSSASITVKPFEPPTISCSASPSDVNPGGTAAISATGMSPQNRPLTYNYSASAGTVTGSGSTATYNSTGAPTGTSTVTCSVSDDKGNSASATAMVNVLAPPPPPGPSPEQKRLEARLALHSVFFPTAQPRAEHPEGGLVDSQQTTLTTLATDFKSYLTFKPDARLTLTGHTDVRGSAEYNQALSDRRVNRVKQFLVEQGVPESSIETRGVGKEQELSADQVKSLVQENPELSDADKAKMLRKLNVIVLAQNRRVDISLSTTGQQSEQIYPFNAADSATLLDEKARTTAKKPAGKKK
jgi:outer membrane protein OmpA-like peptidoglycan-associated protein